MEEEYVGGGGKSDDLLSVKMKAILLLSLNYKGLWCRDLVMEVFSLSLRTVGLRWWCIGG